MYVTGRSYIETANLIDNKLIPKPRLFFSDLGATLNIENQKVENPLINNVIGSNELIDILSIIRTCLSVKIIYSSNNRLTLKILRENSTLDRAIKLLRETNADIYVFSEYINILPKGVNKGAAAKLVLDKMGEFYDLICMVGDSDDDLHLWVKFGQLKIIKYVISCCGIRDKHEWPSDVIFIDGINQLFITMKGDIASKQLFN